MTENEILIHLRELARQLKATMDEYDRVAADFEALLTVEAYQGVAAAERIKRNLVEVRQSLEEKIADMALKLLEARGMETRA